MRAQRNPAIEFGDDIEQDAVAESLAVPSDRAVPPTLNEWREAFVALAHRALTEATPKIPELKASVAVMAEMHAVVPAVVEITPQPLIGQVNRAKSGTYRYQHAVAASLYSGSGGAGMTGATCFNAANPTGNSLFRASAQLYPSKSPVHVEPNGDVTVNGQIIGRLMG